MINVQLPSQLSSLADGRTKLSVQASTLGEVFAKIDEVAPMVRSQLFDPTGAVRQFVGIFVDNKQISEVGDGALPVRPGSDMLIVMSVAGG
jgi:hypothetical protein